MIVPFIVCSIDVFFSHYDYIYVILLFDVVDAGRSYVIPTLPHTYV